MREHEIRRAELAPARYGGAILVALFLLAGSTIAREQGSVLAASQEFVYAALAAAWSWRGWRRLAALTPPTREGPTG